jgi:hypothetical protein
MASVLYFHLIRREPSSDAIPGDGSGLFYARIVSG